MWQSIGKRFHHHHHPAKRRPLLDIGLPDDRSCAALIQRLPATFTTSSVHFVGGLPTLRLPIRGRHWRTFPPQRPSVLLGMYPAHCHIRFRSTKYNKCKKFKLCLLYAFLQWDFDQCTRIPRAQKHFAKFTNRHEKYSNYFITNPNAF
jgi:hypothetical protein